MRLKRHIFYKHQISSPSPHTPAVFSWVFASLRQRHLSPPAPKILLSKKIKIPHIDRCSTTTRQHHPPPNPATAIATAATNRSRSRTPSNPCHQETYSLPDGTPARPTTTPPSDILLYAHRPPLLLVLDRKGCASTTMPPMRTLTRGNNYHRNSHTIGSPEIVSGSNSSRSNTSKEEWRRQVRVTIQPYRPVAWTDRNCYRCVS